MNIVGVKCYSGHTYAGRPDAFTWQGAEHSVAAVEAEWREPSGPCFVVRSVREGRFRLCYNESADEWTLLLSLPEQTDA